MKTIIASAMATALACAAGAALGQISVPIHVLVKQKDIGAPTPFPRVAKFIILRNNMPFANASCPDASDAKGQLTCKLSCPPSDRDETLLLKPPKREDTDIVAGMKVPAALELRVADCRILTPQPVELVYKTFSAQLAELQLSSPDVYKAVTFVNNGRVQLKPFAAASPELAALAQNAEHRRAIGELGELSRLAVEGAAPSPQSTGKDAIPTANTADYAVGTKSVLLNAAASDAVGPDAAARLVKLSPEPVELDKSITRVTKSLGARPVLNKNELQLERAAKAMGSAGPAAFSAYK